MAGGFGAGGRGSLLRGQAERIGRWGGRGAGGWGAQVPLMGTGLEAHHAQHTVAVVCKLGGVGVQGAAPCLQPLWCLC